MKLIRFGIEKQVGKLVYASSMSVYGQQPDAPTPETAIATQAPAIGVGKLAAEQYLRIFAPQLPFIGFRMFNVYGPGQDMQNMRQGMVSIFLAQALNGTEIEVKGALDRYRDFIFIDDVVDIWVQALGNEAPIMIFTILAQGSAPLSVICWTPFKKPPAHAISASLAARRATSSVYIPVWRN